MARVNGLVKIDGTVDDVTFYRKNGKNFIRQKGGVSGERIKTDPSYARTRENNAEFGHCGVAAKNLRTAAGSMVNKAKDSKLSSRMLQAMARVKNNDLISARGSRTVGVGIKLLKENLR